MKPEPPVAPAPERTPKVCVFAPAPLLTVTIESRTPEDEADDEEGDASEDGGELHLHVGGQGFWVARMLATLGTDVVLCATFGGETGAVVRGLLEDEHLVVRGVEVDSPNGAYVHDRRSGERHAVATIPSGRLSRHQIDDLFGVMLVEGLDAELCVLGGPDAQHVLPADTYRRLAADLSANGVPVVVDLSGDQLEAALAGGVTVAKVSHEELMRDGRADGGDVSSLVEAMRRLAGDGAGAVAVTRAEEHALALVGERVVEIAGPSIVPADPKGAGDSFTAGVSAALAWGLGLESALRLGVAAGSLNVSRHGLGSGNREHVERLAEHVELRALRR